MTETKENTKLATPLEDFILHWGDLAGQWGVNRSVGQIHAFLYLAEHPLTAEDIAETLNMARSNVSNSIKELLVWSLIRRVPMKGDRRDHFEAETDIWEIARQIAEGRKQREIDPALKMLRSVSAQAVTDKTVSDVQRQRLGAMLDFTERSMGFFEQALTISRPKLELILKLGAKVAAFLPSGVEENKETDRGK